jgi:hypothetical protein
LSIVYDHPPNYDWESLAGGENLVTPVAMNAALIALWQGMVLTPAWTDYLLEKMTVVSEDLDYLLEAGVPPWRELAIRTAFSGTRTRAGWITTWE